MNAQQTLEKMKKDKFYRLGELIYPLRFGILFLWIVVVLFCVPLLPHILQPFKTTGFVDEHSASRHAQTYLSKQLGYNSENKFLILYHSNTLVATKPLFIDKIKKSLSGLKKFPIPSEIILPKGTQQVSKDKHTAYAVVIVKSLEPLDNHLLLTFKSLIKVPNQMSVQIGGEPIFIDQINQQTEHDLLKADMVAAPIAVIILIMVFGSIVASILPILLGGSAAVLILATLYFLGHLCSLSIFTINIAMLLGLCLTLDYSLFVISRFRDELNRDLSMKEAIAVTQATAGKAIFFSGLAVFASLSALFLFPINILFSVAVGGLTAVAVSVFAAIVILPALLAILKTNINVWSVRWPKKDKTHHHNFWHWIAKKMVKRPRFHFLSILVLLLLLGYPFLYVTFGVSDFHIFPEHSKNRLFFDTYSKTFKESELSPIVILVKSERRSILSYKSLAKLYDFTKQLKQNPYVAEVHSIVTTKPQLTKQQYYRLYRLDPEQQNKDIKKLLATTTGQYFTVIDVISKYPVNSKKTQTLINNLEKLSIGKGLSIELTGAPIDNRDVLNIIQKNLPDAILWIMLSTYIILLLLLRSLFLPIKAIVMNLLSLCACFGALVLVFQEGYLHQFLNFEPQGMLDISLLVIIFCALFGFSMDYEVFLLTRIKEAYDITHDNIKSIVFGIEKSSRIITSAAIIVIFLCGSFLVADVLMIKAFGLGIAVAIFVDAFLIRTVLVPSTMALIKQWNWYLPKWLSRILPKI